MLSEESFASRALKNVSTLMDYEILVSRPGISEPDSNFIWASTFRAPIGVSIVRDEVFFNLFLPAGSENEGDKKLFLNRVGAKFQDDLWQVRRSMSQVSGNYGPAMKLALSLFKSAMVDYSYISNGRTYTHMVFNRDDLQGVSRALLSIPDQVEDLRIEYMKKTGREFTVFRAIDEKEEVSSVTIEASQSDSPPPEGEGDPMFFLMGNILEKGVKTVGKVPGSGVPEILCPREPVQFGNSLVSFSSCNQFLMSLVELMAREYVVIYGFCGSASGNSINLTINLPSRQVPALLRILRKASSNSGEWQLNLNEVIAFSDLMP